MENAEDVVVLVHLTLFVSVILALSWGLRQEYLHAKESWVNSKEEQEVDKHSWEIKNKDEDPYVPKVGESVVHAELGKGQVEMLLGPKVANVYFESINENRTVDIMTLIFLESRVKHATRGFGTIKEFDANDRVHVAFDNGEYHRYKYDTWKTKMQASSRKVKIDRSFQTFLYEYALYRCDYILSTFTLAKPLLLLLGTYMLIVMGATAYSKASGKSLSESLWTAWTFVADPGAHAEESGMLRRGVAVWLTLGGMLVFALMIGIIADALVSLLDGLKQGNSMVIESGHTLILGWSDKTLPLIREIALANESLGKGVIVVMAERPKSEMERELLKEFPPQAAKGTLVICRRGSPTNQTDLRKVSAGLAKSILVLADNKLHPDESDAKAVRVILSLFGVRGKQTGHVVVEMCDIDNRDLAYLADSKNVEVIVAHDLIGRLMIMCAREPGLAQILDELLGFEGDEFYIKHWPGSFEYNKTTFGEILFRFENAVPIGIKPFDRHDAYEQIKSSKWRKQSLRRRDWDGTPPPPRPQNIDEEGEGNGEDGSEEKELHFALRGVETNAPIVDMFDLEQVNKGKNGKEWYDQQQHEGANDDADEEHDHDENRQSRAVIINPPNDYILREKDEILVIAEDDDTYAPKDFSQLPKICKLAYEAMERCHRPTVQTRSEKVLFCGWRRDMDDMIMELDKLVGPGSELTIMCMTEEKDRIKAFAEGGLDVTKLKNLSLIHEIGNPVLTRHLNRLRSEINSFGSVLILADQALETNSSSADSRSLASLLLIRDKIARKNKKLSKLNLSTTPKNSTSNTRPYSLEKMQSFADGESSLNLLRDNSGILNSPNADEPRSLSDMTSPSTTFRSLGPGNLRNLLQATSSSNLLQSTNTDYFVRRPSSVGQALFFENAHNTGSTILISEILDSRTKALVPVAQIGDHVMSNEIVAACLAMVSECRDISVVLSELLQADGNDLHIRSALDYGKPGEKIDFWSLQSRARARGEIVIGYRLPGDKVPTLNPHEKCGKIALTPRATIIVVSED